MKKNLIAITIVIGMLLTVTPVQAKGTARVEFHSENQISIGETFIVKLSVTDVQNTDDGVVSMGGIISYDSDIIEYISAEEVEQPYQFWINEENHKIAGVDFTMQNGIRDTTVVYQFTFRAKNEGTTIITLEDARLTDCDDYLDINILDAKLQVIKTQVEESNTNEIGKDETVDNTLPEEEKNNNMQEKDSKKEIVSSNHQTTKPENTKIKINSSQKNEKQEELNTSSIAVEEKIPEKTEESQKQEIENESSKKERKAQPEKTSVKKKEPKTFIDHIQKLFTDILGFIKKLFE